MEEVRNGMSMSGHWRDSMGRDMLARNYHPPDVPHWYGRCLGCDRRVRVVDPSLRGLDRARVPTGYCRHCNGTSNPRESRRQG